MKTYISLLHDFNNCQSELQAWLFVISMMLIGVLISLILDAVFTKKRDTYYHGQIDAIRGIIKWKLERNKDGEEVWVEKNEEKK